MKAEIVQLDGAHEVYYALKLTGTGIAKEGVILKLPEHHYQNIVSGALGFFEALIKGINQEEANS